MINLTGRVALVTGASRGIGRACAERLADAGADVVVNYVTSKNAAEEAAQTIAAKGRHCYVVKADVSEKDDVESLADFIKREIGQLDIVVSNAATGGFRPLLNTTENNFRAAFNTNVLSLIYLVQATYPLLQKAKGRGKVIGLSSHGAEAAIPWYGLIGASKAALESIARHITLEVGEYVNVNIVKAGLVDTDSTRRIPNSQEMFDSRPARSMIGNRFLTAKDVADAVLFLSSPLSDLVQGQILTVDGGEGIHP
ncbi:MAG: SDR family oxidoreductase [Planctomycetaceae bacterium]|jgi:enoyl-[acyl-carrier protein] reductase III|nr:SDR family oxidoreductase [Planctomycetaceae bacterium]